MPDRIQLSRRKGYRKPEDAIVVARPSRWGNPYSIDTFGRLLAIDLYRETVQGFWTPRLLMHVDDTTFTWAHAAHERFHRRLGGHPMEIARTDLAGHDLACWCAPGLPCHADVLLELANA